MKRANTVKIAGVVPASLFLGVLLSAIPLAAQTQAAHLAPETVIRTTTRLVQVNIVAQDKKGHAVAGLEKEDFEVFDNHKQQPVAMFVGETMAPGPTAPAVPNTFTNSFATSGGARSGYAVILLDWLNTPWGDRVRGRTQTIRMLRQINATDKVALYVLDQQLRVVQDFTVNTAELVRKLGALGGRAPDEDEVANHSLIADASVASWDRDLLNPSSLGRAATGDAQERLFRLDRRIRDTLQAFDAIADHLAGVPGRKSLIWVSAAFPRSAGTTSYSDEIAHTMQRMNEADVAIYPIDARGLTAGGGWTNIAVMEEFASRTGGKAYHDRNDLDTGMRIALDDLLVSYTLAYYAPPDEKGGFHQITVKTRRPGVTLRHRDGYYVNPPGKVANNDRVSDLRRAMLNPADATTIPVRAVASRTQDRLALRVLLALETLTLVRSADRWMGQIDLAARFSSEDGDQTGVSSLTLAIDLHQQTYDLAMKEGIILHKSWPIPPNSTRVRILVRDNGSGQIGTLTIPLREVTEEKE